MDMEVLEMAMEEDEKSKVFPTTLKILVGKMMKNLCRGR